MLIQAKQINKFLMAPLGLTSFTTSAASSDTTLFNTAIGSTVTALALTVPSTTVGGPTAAGVSLTGVAPIFVTGTKNRLLDGGGNDVYALIGGAFGAYTATYFSNVAGVATAYTFVAATNIDLEVPFIFAFADLPQNAIMAVTQRHVAPDPAVVTRIQTDVLSPSTSTALSRNWNGQMFALNVNGQVIGANAASAGAVIVTANAITYNTVSLGYTVAATDLVTVTYTF